MNLMEVIRNLDLFDEDDTIYAKRPWTENSLAIVEREPEEGEPEALKKYGLSYFLEIFIAKEILEDWEKNVGHVPTLEEKCDRVIYYATYDA